MTNESNRRRFLKATGTAVVGATLAGCAGGGGDGETTTTTSGDGDGQTTTTAAGTTTTGGGGADISGTTFEFWDVLNVQSGAAKRNIEQTVQQFSQDTGANVQVNYSGYQQLAGAKWISSFQQGNYPQVYTGDLIFMGPFANGGWLRPFDEWKNELGDEVLSNIEWMMEPLRRGNRWMSRAGLPSDVYTLPLALVPRNAFSARMDHFEQAGLDPAQDFPPKNFDDLVRVATTLQENGPGEYGFQVFGDPNDWLDVMLPWAYADGGKAGGYMNDETTAVNFDNSSWKMAASQANAVYNEHGLSSPQTPTISDEEVSQLMMAGQVSMSMVEWLNFPEFMERAPSLVEGGGYRYGNMWTQPSGQPGAIGFYGIGLTKPPEGADQATWERKQTAALEFLKRFFSKEFQRTMVESTGALPVRQDVWQELDVPHEDQHHFVEVSTSMAKQMQESHVTHPLFSAVANNGMAPRMQQMFRGEHSPEEACDLAAQDANALLDDWWSKNG